MHLSRCLSVACYGQDRAAGAIGSHQIGWSATRQTHTADEERVTERETYDKLRFNNIIDYDNKIYIIAEYLADVHRRIIAKVR